MSTGHREVEDCYDVDPAAVPPRLAGLPGVASVTEPVEHTLEATYFDTDDLALAGAGITLRRRTGGEDAGWHLKLPVAGARHEVSLPLGRARVTVPKALRETVRALTLDRPLHPVATLTNRRSVRRLLDADGRVLAELADDRVGAETPAAPSGAGTTLTWREWEVELVEGDVALLAGVGEALTAAGARPAAVSSKLARALGERLPQRTAAPPPGPDDPAAEVLRARLADQLGALRRHDPLVRADLAGGVHGMRVAIRRLRDALATHRPLLDATVTDPVRDELRWLARSLGPARDAEVQRRRVMRQVAELAVHDDGELVRGPVLARVEQHLTEHETRARSAVLEILDGERYRILLGTLVELVADPPFSELATQPATEVLRARAKHDLKRLRARVRAAEDLPDRRDRPAALHEARKAAKRARYAAEPLVAVVGRPARRYVKAVKRVQSALGDHHDAVVAQALLRDLADEAATAGENGFSYGELHRRESEAQSAGEQRFEDAWRRVSRKKRRRWLG